MGRLKPIAVDLLADLPAGVDAVPAQSMPPPKPKRIKKAQPKAKATEVEAEDALPISKLAESSKSQPSAGKRYAEAQPSESSKSKRPRSFSATTSKSKVPNVPWTPEITLEDKPVMATDSANDINVGVALSTALLLPSDLEKNAGMSEYKNYAFMLQRCVQAVQHAHSFSMQSFENREKLTDLQKEYSALQKINKGLQVKMKKLEDQAEAATKAQTLAEEKAEVAEAIKKVAEAQKNEAEDKATQAEKELQEALATKKAEIKEADEKAYAQGMADVTEEYKLQVRQACNRGFFLGWMSLLKRLDLPADSPFRNADAIPLPFPPLPPSQAEEESGSEPEDEDDHDAEALMKKPKGDAGVKSPSQIEPILDLTQDEEIEEVPKEVNIGMLSSDLLLAERSLTKTLAEIDAELVAEKAAEVVPQESAEVILQESDEVQTQILSEVEKS